LQTLNQGTRGEAFNMICPHGQLDESTCPECSLLNNVKPLARASNVAFTEMLVSRVAPTPSATNDAALASSTDDREIPTTTLRIKRLPVDDQDGALVLGNSGSLHARLKQVLGRGFEVGILDDGVERRVKQIQKRETNPRARLE
jgi:hypothetical protein